MLMRCTTMLLVVPLVACSAMASAQSIPPPGFHERELAQIIRQAGYDCRTVESIDISPSPDPAFDTMRPEVATCSNKKKFLVVKSGRGGVNARPVVRPLPTDI